MRLAAELQRTISELLRHDVKDPRIAGVSLTTVDLTRDLGVAHIYFSLLDPDQSPAAALQGLERASGFLRSRLGKVLKVRNVPELRFAHDDSGAESARISRLIDDAVHGGGNS